MEARASVFVGSSTEGLPVAEAVQQALDHVADVTLWSQGIFDLSQSYLESLVQALDLADFAILILTPDDLTLSRKKNSAAPRDNVIFELGLFMGRLGRERSFFVFDRSQNLKLPTDLLGIAAATYRPHHDGNFQAALGPACAEIRKIITSLGRRPKILRMTPGETRSANLPDLSGTWAGYSPEGPNPSERNSTLQIEQHGSFVHATIERKADGGLRIFKYEGRFTSGQLVLFFEEEKGRGFIVGTVVLYLSGNLRTLVGRSTYYDHTLKEVISKARRYERLAA